MGRRRGSLFKILLILPWWVAVVVGAIGYAVVTYVLPLIWKGQMLGAAAKGLQPIGAVWFLVCAIAAFGSAVRAVLTRRKFDQQESIEDIRALSWREFESIVGEAFRRRGYSVIENEVGGPDGGVDLVLRMNGETFYVQCKQWKKTSVGVRPIRELFGVATARGAAGGIFVCSGSYTREATEFAKQCGIELIDGAQLLQMIEIARAPEPFLDPTQGRREPLATVPAISPPACPNCGAAMVDRIARRGVHVGSRFWGCPAYPKCRATRQL